MSDRRLMLGDTPPYNVAEITHSEAVAGDILAFDGANKRLFRFVDEGATDLIQNYTPIGVVVIPTSHNVYGDGSCGVMSLKPMNCSTPSTGGTSEQPMYWGVSGTDISALPNLNRVPIVGSGSNVGDASSIVTGEEYYAYLPSDKFSAILSAVQCPHDTDAFYYTSPYIPSPYLTDESRNPGYYQTSSPSSSSNALADFDGIGNTEKIIAQRGTKDYNSWTPDRKTEADYPAASCCDMFYTEGTSQGDWYLPACGELGYIMPPFNKINDTIGKMRTAYGSSVGVELNISRDYWSSTEYGIYVVYYVGSSSGRVNYVDKGYYDTCVRAFLKVSPFDMLGISPGVYVYANNGKLYNPDNWDTANNNSALGVAVVTDNCQFAISKELHLTDNIVWSSWLAGDIGGISNSTPDYEGQSNTNIIRAKTITQESSSDSYNASYYAASLTLAGKNGYLPAASELCVLWSNRDKINDVLTIIGSTTIDEKMKEFGKSLYPVWTSTNGVSAANTATVLYYGEEGNSCSYGGARKSYSTNTLFAFPFFPITETVHVTIHVDTYQITFQFRKGDSVNLSYYTPGAYATVFLGWYETEDFSGEALTQIDSIQSDMTLYAKLSNSPDNP